MKNIAIILAGGAGKRFGADRPKQFLPLADGRSVLEHAVAAFRACDCIDDVLVVMHPDWIDSDECKALNVRLVAGGKERWESSVNALRTITGECNVLIHDAARPFVSERIIRDVCEALAQHEAVSVAVPATDTMYYCPFPAASGTLSPSRCAQGKGERYIEDIPDRATMMRAQTPQAFRLSLIRQAYKIALQDPNLQSTDDCGIVHKYLPETPIYIVEGEEANRKITFKEDL